MQIVLWKSFSIQCHRVPALQGTCMATETARGDLCLSQWACVTFLLAVQGLIRRRKKATIGPTDYHVRPTLQTTQHSKHVNCCTNRKTKSMEHTPHPIACRSVILDPRAGVCKVRNHRPAHNLFVQSKWGEIVRLKVASKKHFDDYVIMWLVYRANNKTNIRAYSGTRTQTAVQVIHFAPKADLHYGITFLCD